MATLLVLAACGGSSSSTSAGSSGGGKGGTLRLSGSTTVNPVAADAAEVLRKRGMEITVDDQGGSAGGISQLGQGQVEIAMSSKAIGDADRKAFPSVSFVSTQIGADAVGIVVRREVFDGGVRNLSRDQAKALFEGRVRNWRELGGPDVAVFVYDKEPGRGTREVLDKFLYGPNGQAPPPPQSDSFAIVGANEEGRAKVLSTPGGVTPLSTSFITGYPKLAAASIEGVDPSPAHIVDGTYALARPLFLVTNGPPTGAAKTFVDYVVSDDGQALVRKAGYLDLATLGIRP
jgi:phosphate transport system substrate-binding protein